MRYLHRRSHDAVRLVGNAEEDQRRSQRITFIMTLHGGDFRGLIVERVLALRMPRNDLQRRDDCRHPHRHREHDPRALAWPLAVVPFAQQMPCADRADDERDGQISPEDRVDQPVGHRRVEDNRPPIEWHELTDGVDPVPLRCVHP